jgi:hypothetical protein
VKVTVLEQLIELDVKTEKKYRAYWSAEPHQWSPAVFFFRKQVRFDPAVWKTCLLSVMELQSRNLSKLLHQRKEFSHFFINFLDELELLSENDRFLRKKKSVVLPLFHGCSNFRLLFEKSFQVRDFSFWIIENIGLIGVSFCF